MLDPSEHTAPWRSNAAPAAGYDIVIVGGGLHAVALAYYLATAHAVDSVAVVAKGALRGQASGPQFAIIKPHPWLINGAELGLRSGPLYEHIASACDQPDLRIARDQLTVARSVAELNSCRWRVELAKASGGSSSIIDAAGVRSSLVALAPETPVAGGQLTAGSGVLRLDAAVDAYARGAADAGVSIFETTPVIDVLVEHDRVRGVRTTAGSIDASVVVVCAPGWAALVAEMAGLSLPVVPRRHESLLTETSDIEFPVVAGFASEAVQIAPVGRGSALVSGAVSRFGTYSSQRSLTALDQLASGALALVPRLERVRLHRHYSAVVDVTADGNPMVGPTSIDGLLTSAGWGMDGAAIAPAVASELAASIATNELSALLDPLTMDRLAPESHQEAAR